MNLCPIFNQEWWLKASTDGNYQTINIENDGLIIANISFFVKKHLGLIIIDRPPYTRTLGPRLFLPQSKPFRREQNIRNTISKLVEKFPKYDSIRISLDPDDETPFAFSLCGFDIQQKFTFRIPKNLPSTEVWDNLDHKTRNLIRTADKKLSVSTNTDINDFIKTSLINKNFRENTHDFRIMKNIFLACIERNQSCVMSARNEKNEIVASAILIWDQINMYYWQSARDPYSNIAGSNMLLIWKSIELSQKKELTFDFDSFASEKSAKMIASFGQRPVARPQILNSSLTRQWERVANSTLLKIRDKSINLMK